MSRTIYSILTVYLLGCMVARQNTFQFFLIVAPCILISVEFTHQQMHNK